MRVTLLDTQTRRTAEVSGYSTQYWEEGNGSCDCNRELQFGEDSSEGICRGCHRYLIIAAEVEDGDDYECSIGKLNSEYPDELLKQHGITVDINQPKVFRGDDERNRYFEAFRDAKIDEQPGAISSDQRNFAQLQQRFNEATKDLYTGNPSNHIMKSMRDLADSPCGIPNNPIELNSDNVMAYMTDIAAVLNKKVPE